MGQSHEDRFFKRVRALGLFTMGFAFFTLIAYFVDEFLVISIIGGGLVAHASSKGVHKTQYLSFLTEEHGGSCEEGDRGSGTMLEERAESNNR